jgi:protein-S-isoprenylcysteine O-methyltransferase Ste14
MTTKIQLVIGIIIFFLSLGAAVYKLNSDYKLYSKLTFPGSLTFLGIFILQGWLAGTSIFIPAGFVQNQVLLTLGIVLMVSGLFFVFIAICQIGDYKKVLGSNTSAMVTSKIYSFTRHPQYIGYTIFQIGAAMAWWNHYAIVAIVTVIILIYIVAFIEEKHLFRTFGHQYLDYCRQVKRFL